MEEDLISNDSFGGSEVGVMEEINDIDFGIHKCDMRSTSVDGVVTYNVQLELDNSDNSVVDGDKNKRGLDIDLNTVDNEKNELSLGDSVPMSMDVEGLGAHNGEGGLLDYNKKKNEMDSIANEVGYGRDLLGVSFEEKIDDCEEADIETAVVKTGIRRRSEIMSEKERNSESTINRKNDDSDIDTIVPRRKRERPSTERHVERDVDEKVGVSAGDYANFETVVDTSGFKKKRNEPHTFKKKVDVNDGPDKDIIIQKRNRGRPCKERYVESDIEGEDRVSAGDHANVETYIGTSGTRTRSGKLPKEKGKARSTFKNNIDVGDDSDFKVIVPKMKRGRPPKEMDSVSNEVGYVRDLLGVSLEEKTEDCEEADIETTVVKSRLRKRLESVSKKERNSERTINGKIDVDNADSDMEVIAPRNKRGRPPKERRIKGIVWEKVQVRSGVKKGGYVDNVGDQENDEETALDLLASGFHREKGEWRIGLDDTEHMECGEDSAAGASGDNHRGKQKAEEGSRERKRKMMENSVRDLEDGALRKKTNETSSDDDSEGVGGISTRERKNEGDVASNKIAGKMKVESSHLFGRKKRNLKGVRGRPPKREGKSGIFKTIDDEKQKNHGLKKVGVKVLPEKVIKGSNFEDNSEKHKGANSSDGEGKKIVVKQPNKKNHEKKREGMIRSTQKQLLKDRLKDMLINAGWTIEHRPRNGKENVFDAVYVCPRGKGYWSVTLAYKILKQEVENGKADSKAVSAFVPITEDEWNSLLRITKKKLGLENNSTKGKVIKDQSGKEISRNKILKTKHVHAKEKDQLRLKHKEKLKKTIGKDRQNKKRLTLLARGSKKGSDLNGGNFLPYEGQLSLLSWMIDLGTVKLGEKVKSMDSSRTKVLLEGKVTKNGIHCDCCSKNFALSDFNSHAGNSLGQPLQNIYLDSKISLLQSLRDSWTKYGESMKLGFHSVDINDDPNDDTCNMCGDGGNLICCDSCPSAIHQKCLNLQEFPSGDWNCVYCSCKFCGMVGETTLDEDNNCRTSGPKLPTCRLCEEKYHLLCVQGQNMSHNEPNSPTFCSQKCQEIFHQLEVLMGVKHQMEEGYSWMLIHHSDDNLEISSLSSANNVECNAKLAVAWSIMDECFLPIVDQRSRINMIRNVVFSCGSNIRRLNYTGFFIAILERGDEIISAASLRIHGNLLAEMPFIGTRHAYRRQGMCRRLLNAIETALSSLNVEKLVLPAISALQQTWTSVFGFMPLEDSHKNEMKCMNMIAFPGVDMLQKRVVKQLFGIENLSSATDYVFSNGPSEMTCELVNCQGSITINDNDCKRGDKIAPSENDCQVDNCQNLDGSNKQENVPSDDLDKRYKQEIVPLGCCDVATDGNPKLNEQEFGKVEDRTAVSETVTGLINCDSEESNEQANVPSESNLNEREFAEVEITSAVSETVSAAIDCEMKTAHLSDIKEIVDCVVDGEENAINHSRDQHHVKKRNISTQALVLV